MGRKRNIIVGGKKKRRENAIEHKQKAEGKVSTKRRISLTSY
jgi:hypothetical protein